MIRNSGSLARACGLLVAVGFALLAGWLLPAGAAAKTQTYTYLSTDDLYPTGGAGTYGPAYKYPSTVTVSGLPRKVTKVRLTILGYQSARPTDTDLVLSGPNGRIAMAQQPLRRANPWMALRHGGDSPNFVLEELSCPDCATLISVREVRREPETRKGP